MAQYRRSIFLINRPFQLRFALYVCSWLFALSLVYPLIIESLFEFFIRNAALDPMGPALSKIQSTRGEMLWLLGFLQLLLLLVTFAISVFLSHRIAGPLYKLRKAFEEAKNGNLRQELAFRKTDHFQDLARDFNAMTQGLRGILARNVDTSAAAISRIEKALETVDKDKSARAELEEALAALREIRERTPL
jgi:nitrogen fixation/metabolism regulation signal transduction histidine kinase